MKLLPLRCRTRGELQLWGCVTIDSPSIENIFIYFLFNKFYSQTSTESNRTDCCKIIDFFEIIVNNASIYLQLQIIITAHYTRDRPEISQHSSTCWFACLFVCLLFVSWLVNWKIFVCHVTCGVVVCLDLPRFCH